MEFKGTKELKILHSNELGYSLGDNEHNTRITFWGVDSETKANILLMLRAHEMLEMLNSSTEVLKYVLFLFENEMAFSTRFRIVTHIKENEQLIKGATEIN